MAADILIFAGRELVERTWIANAASHKFMMRGLPER
jgi:hypothetical protein